MSLSLKKQWTEEGRENLRPVTFRLLADGEEINSVTLDGSAGWEYRFSKDRAGNDLYKYAEDGSGREIVYSIEEDSPGEYWTVDVSQDENGTWVFTNDYHVPKPTELVLTAKKYFNGKPARGSSYTFILSDEEGNTLQTVNNDGSEISFAPLVFEEEGRHTFYISEKKGGNPSVKYDTARFTVNVEVSLDRDYELEYSIMLGDKPVTDGIAFFNVPHTTPPTGDNSRLGLFIALMLGSAAAIGLSLWFIRKKRK